MPRGFLIKRKKHMPWNRRGSEESERISESGSDNSAPDQPSHENGSTNSSSSPPISPVNLSTKKTDVFSQGLDLTTKSSSTREHDSDNVDNGTEKYSKPITELSVTNNNEPHRDTPEGYLDAHKKEKDNFFDNAKFLMQYREYNNNSTRNPLAAFNRENYHSYLPSSAPLSISTSTWSPYYLAAFDHLAVNSSPSSQSSSPRSLPTAPPPPPSPQTQLLPASNKKRAHPSPAGPKPTKACKKTKAQRKIEFDEDKSSPVSGTYIREEGEDGIKVVSGDIDSNLNLVEITPEAEAELSKIDNKIGDFRCQLCKELYENAFGLAQHRCSRIVHVEYRCPECDKVFNCPANLASHRRWHKPRGQQAPKTSQPLKLQPNGQTVLSDGSNRSTPSPAETTKEDAQFSCKQCGKLFKRQAYLRKHMNTHVSSEADKPFPCHLCGKVILNEAEKTKHALQHAMPPVQKDMFQCGLPPPLPQNGQPSLNIPNDFFCRVCGSTLPDSISFDQHMRMHGSTDIYPCKYCPSTFYSSPGLSRHISKCHTADGRPPIVMLPIPPLNRPC